MILTKPIFFLLAQPSLIWKCKGFLGKEQEGLKITLWFLKSNTTNFGEFKHKTDLTWSMGCSKTYSTNYGLMMLKKDSLSRMPWHTHGWRLRLALMKRPSEFQCWGSAMNSTLPTGFMQSHSQPEPTLAKKHLSRGHDVDVGGGQKVTTIASTKPLSYDLKGPSHEGRSIYI